jgi:MFS family permease
LGVGFLFYFSYATVFYFIKNLAQPGSGNPAYDIGLFFSLYTALMLCVRLLAGKYMDRLPKHKTLLGFSVVWLVTFLLLPLPLNPLYFYLLAVVYGLCVSILLPILNSEIFVQSEPTQRAAHTNMVLFTMDAGYFLSPLIGGLLFIGGSHTMLLFYLCAICILISIVFIFYAGGYHVHLKPTRTL